MILVLVDKINTRIEYTFDFIFVERGVMFELTEDQEYYLKFEGNKANYSSKNIYSKIQVKPSNLLISSNIELLNVLESTFNNEACLSFNGITDPVATIFYILSRYEEYQHGKLDEHKRFPFKESILHKFNWVEKAICDRLSVKIIHFIADSIEVNIQSDRNKRDFEMVPTFDIDNAFAYKYKTSARQSLSVMKDVFNGDKRRIKERKEVLTNEKSDPYDTFDRIIEISKSFPSAKLFWLVPSDEKKDRNVPISNESIQKTILNLSKSISVNLHPSYASFLSLSTIKKEKKTLEDVLKSEIHSSRQHFLKFKLPNTFQDLIKAKFADEYSMGFAENIGFRSGTARTHKWFDLSKNEITDLRIHPFVYMDGTLNEYMKLTIDSSKLKINKLYQEVKNFGGDFTFLWHNETIGDYQKWRGWSEVLDFTLKLKENE